MSRRTMRTMQRTWTRHARLVMAGMLLWTGAGAAQGGAEKTPQASASEFPITQAWKDFKMLRVCGDPENMPFSDQKQQGFENKIAQVIASALGDSVVYVWWPHRRGFLRNTLSAAECDVVMGVPTSYDPVLTTKPYYRSTYYIVTRTDRKLDITSLDDPRLKGLRIAVGLIGDDYTNTPPAQALASHGITKNVKGYSTFYDTENHPQDIVDAVIKGDVDVALVWGPVAGYFAKQSGVPLSLAPLPDSDKASGVPFAYDVGIGVRHSDQDLRATLDSILVNKHADIDRVLREYNVPVLRKTP